MPAARTSTARSRRLHVCHGPGGIRPSAWCA